MLQNKFQLIIILFFTFLSVNSFANSADSTANTDTLLSCIKLDSSTVSTPEETILPAEQTVQKQFVPKWYDMFKNLPSNWKRYYDETFTTKMIPAIIGMTIVTGGMIISDEDSWKWSRRWYEGSNTVHKASDIFVFMGDGMFQFGLAAAFASYGFAFDDAKALRTASQVTEVILTAGGVIQVLKHLTGRESPIVRTIDGGKWDFFPNQIEYHKHVPHYDAFPSGHICTATATLVVIMENYPDVTWLKPVGYTLLGCISTALITTSIHWWSDIPLGIAIGYTFGKIAANPLSIPLSKEVDEKPKTSLKILPTYSINGPGVSFNLTF